MNLFNFVQDLIIADAKIKGLPYPVRLDDASPSSVNPDDVPDYIEPINPDDCDCKDWN